MAHLNKKGCHTEPVEAWWAGLCAQPFGGVQGDAHFGRYFFVMSIDGLLLFREGGVRPNLLNLGPT